MMAIIISMGLIDPVWSTVVEMREKSEKGDLFYQYSWSLRNYSVIR